MSRRRHRPGCGHCPRVRALGREFQCWRAAWDAAAEQASAGYAAELATWSAEHRPPTFRDYLIAMTGSGWPMSGRAPQAARWAA